MKGLIFWGFVLCIGPKVFARTESLPPVGNRDYLLELHKPASPVEIQPRGIPAKLEGISVMRDPLPFGVEIRKGLVEKTSPRESGPDAPKARQVSKMVFQKMAVKGRYSVPRVVFPRAEIVMKREEEPILVDYRKKMKESENSLRDFEW